MKRRMRRAKSLTGRGMKGKSDWLDGPRMAPRRALTLSTGVRFAATTVDMVGGRMETMLDPHDKLKFRLGVFSR